MSKIERKNAMDNYKSARLRRVQGSYFVTRSIHDVQKEYPIIKYVDYCLAKPELSIKAGKVQKDVFSASFLLIKF